MNALRHTAARNAPSANRPVNTAFAPVIDRDRARDFGVGYGNSSGYASARRYARTPVATRFRFG